MATPPQSPAAPELPRITPHSISSAACAKDTEAGIDTSAELNQRIFISLLEAFFQERDDEDEDDEGTDDIAAAGGFDIATGCEKLTGQIMQLEHLRQTVARLLAQTAGVPENLRAMLQLLIEGYDCKIRDCEEQLDRLLEPNRRRSSCCGMLADYYIG